MIHEVIADRDQHTGNQVVKEVKGIHANRFEVDELVMVTIISTTSVNEANNQHR